MAAVLLISKVMMVEAWKIRGTDVSEGLWLNSGAHGIGTMSKLSLNYFPTSLFLAPTEECSATPELLSINLILALYLRLLNSQCATWDIIPGLFLFYSSSCFFIFMFKLPFYFFFVLTFLVLFLFSAILFFFFTFAF